jgi:predicted Rossmann-fold nucleotide-binding protein
MSDKFTKIKMRDWTETKAHSSWQIFKIMAEFVQGFESLAKVGPCISIFGSARTKPGHKYYELSVEIAKRLAEEGFGIITGGGPGIMEAANKGASMAAGRSVGLSISLPFEQSKFIMMPGGWGTMDEFFEIATLVQTRKFFQAPMICVGSAYWKGLFDWMRETMQDTESNISPGDLELIKIFDTADEVVAHVHEFYTHNKLQPNF